MSKAQALNRPTTCGAEIDRRARRDEQPPCQTSKKHQSGNARRVSIRARRVDACAPSVDACAPSVDSCAPSVDSCAPSVDSCAPCVDACAPCVDWCLSFSCKTVGRPPFGTYRPSPLERIAPPPGLNCRESLHSSGLNWSESLQRRASSSRFARTNRHRARTNRHAAMVHLPRFAVILMEVLERCPSRSAVSAA